MKILGHELDEWALMAPFKGPPLPQWLNILWPWSGKGEGSGTSIPIIQPPITPPVTPHPPSTPPPIAVVPFNYEGLVFRFTNPPQAPAWYSPVFSAKITNPASYQVKRIVTARFEAKSGRVYNENFDLELPAGGSFTYNFDNNVPGPGGYIKITWGHPEEVKAWLADDAGGKMDPMTLYIP